MSQPITEDTSQYIDNKSFDPAFQTAAVEIVGHDANNDVLRRVQVDENGSLTIGDLALALKQVLNSIARPIYLDPTTGRININNAASVTTVTTVTGATNWGGQAIQATQLFAQTRIDYGINVRSRIL